MKVIGVSFRFFLFFTLLCGVVYPLLLTFFGRVFYPDESQGSLIHRDGRLVGSELIGQLFTGDSFFHGRPSVGDYNPMPSKASHLPIGSPALKEQVHSRLLEGAGVPPELLFASGSGLDPHISLEAALYQLERVAKARGLNDEQKQELSEKVQRLVQQSIFGPKVVSVWELNALF